MKHIDVVIISWAKNEELVQVTKDGLDSLFENDKGITYHVYIVESNKDIKYEDMEEYQRKWMHTIETVYTDEVFGYNKYLNIGRRLGKSPYVALCNSDLTYEENWATNIIEQMEVHNALSASPWCPQTQGPNKDHVHNIYMGTRVRGELAGWCIIQKREIYKIIEDLNEGVSFWYSDNIYADELEMRGIRHILVPTSIVNHHEFSLGKTGSSLSHDEQQKITLLEFKNYNIALETLKNKLHIN
jgi:GT2 family glycosyltransferase